MTFERTEDLHLVREILTHPRIFPWITDDGSPSADEYQPPSHSSIWYVLVLDGEDLLGLWMFVPQNLICWEAHTCLLPGHGLQRGRDAAKAVIQWVWDNTICLRLVTNVPKFNRAALSFAKAAGLKEFGVNESSFMRFGKLHDQILLGVSKCQQL